MAERQNYTFPQCPLKKSQSQNGKIENNNTVSNMLSCRCLSGLLAAGSGLVTSAGRKVYLG